MGVGVAEKKELLRHVYTDLSRGESGATTRQSGRGYRVDHHRDHGSGGTSRGKQEVIGPIPGQGEPSRPPGSGQLVESRA
jgi:hypothetical protein